jgi:hypothetical protein
MNKTLAHTILLIGDILCLWGLWIGYHGLINVLSEVNSQIEIINFGSRDGFFTAAVILPIAHMVAILEYFFPAYIKKHMKIFNISAIIALVIFIFAGFYISSWLKSKVENTGYVYCRNASGVSALARTLVYTKSMDICEELIASKQKR